MSDINSLIELDRLAREDGKKYAQKRFLYESLAQPSADRHFTGIVGPRGAGKTILLKQIALNSPNSFYLALDTFREDLFETVKSLQANFKIRLFLLDEVHMHSNFEESLKKIYDFLDVQVVFTSSVALALYQSVYDLSRRVILRTLYPFSFREYLLFKYGRNVSVLTVEDIVEKKWSRGEIESGTFFPEYLKGGNLPFALQELTPLSLLRNILGTVIYKDIAKISKLGIDELDKIAQMISFIGKSGIDGINASSLSKNLSITKYKAGQYAELLERAFILHRILPEGTGVLKEPKIVMALPYRLLYRSYEEAIGGLREDFFVESAAACGLRVNYLKSTLGKKTPDYILSGNKPIVFEIGGRGKGRQQFKGFQADQKIILNDAYDSNGIRRPIFLFGFMAS